MLNRGLRAAIVAIAMSIGVLGCGQAGSLDDDSGWEAFEAASTRTVHGKTIYVVEWDLALSRDELHAYYLAHVAPRAGIAVAVSASTVNTVDDRDDLWAGQQRDLTYCVSTEFAGNHARAVAEITQAANAWHAARVRFRYVPAHDGNCDNGNPAIAFSVEPWNGGGACAFFPSGGGCVARTLVMDYADFDSNLFYRDNAPNVTTVGVFRHELGHILGLRHEQVQVQVQGDGTCGEDASWRPVTGYDQGSVMHYPWCNGNRESELALTALDLQGVRALYGAARPRYKAGDWDGDGRDNVAVRRGGQILMDHDFSGGHDFLQAYGNGNDADEYLVGDWDGDGRDNVAMRTGSLIWMDYDFDGAHDFVQAYGNGNDADEYLVGDWDGDGRDNVAMRTGDLIWMDYNFDGAHDFVQAYGNGNDADEYLVGDWVAMAATTSRCGPAT
jgi:hypothetical protein